MIYSYFYKKIVQCIHISNVRWFVFILILILLLLCSSPRIQLQHQPLQRCCLQFSQPVLFMIIPILYVLKYKLYFLLLIFANIMHLHIVFVGCNGWWGFSILPISCIIHFVYIFFNIWFGFDFFDIFFIFPI